MKSCIRLVPWWLLISSVAMTFAFILAIAAGRTIEAIIIGILLAPSLVVLVLYTFAWTRGLMGDEKAPPQ